MAFSFLGTESKEAASAVGDGETKPASPSSSSSPPVHCSPPAMEARSSNAGPAVDNPQLNNSHPVQGINATSEGRSHFSATFWNFVLPVTLSSSVSHAKLKNNSETRPNYCDIVIYIFLFSV